jgi:DMSO/TMAO reductase YedYZ molybdopterin-dependent catalytic subunit
MAKIITSRRNLLRSGLIAASGMALSGCDAFDFLSTPDNRVRNFMERANDLTFRAQRLVIGSDGMAQEFTEADIRQPMRPNGVTQPDDDVYAALARNHFADYRLEVRGLVETPLSLSIGELMGMPARTQITRHDCVEGWSCIAKWTGVPLAAVLDRAGVRPQARYVMFHCLDTIEQGLSGDVKYYGSIDLIDARHPQTILAYGMNDQMLPIENGAPLRVRVERQLGYKMPKYVGAIELVDTFGRFGFGKGGYWEDRGYDWYGGI